LIDRIVETARSCENDAAAFDAAFMEELKQRCTRWLHRQHLRKGTLWEERYRSVLVEGEVIALTAVAVYIDLNPVRAGLAESPEDCPWSGGRARARRGLLSILARHAGTGAARLEAAAAPVLSVRLQSRSNAFQLAVPCPWRARRGGVSPPSIDQRPARRA